MHCFRTLDVFSFVRQHTDMRLVWDVKHHQPSTVVISVPRTSSASECRKQDIKGTNSWLQSCDLCSARSGKKHRKKSLHRLLCCGFSLLTKCSRGSTPKSEDCWRFLLFPIWLRCLVKSIRFRNAFYFLLYAPPKDFVKERLRPALGATTYLKAVLVSLNYLIGGQPSGNDGIICVSTLDFVVFFGSFAVKGPTVTKIVGAMAPTCSCLKPAPATR